VTIVEVLGIVVVCLAIVLGLLAWLLVVLHQRRLIASPGSLPVALKRDGQRWANGVGRYAGDELLWYRTLSLSPVAAVRMPRGELVLIGSRPWDEAQDMALRPNLRIVDCQFRGSRISLGFPDNGWTGFQSWLEASAPRF